MPPTSQTDLFGDEPTRPTATDLRIVRQSRAPLTKAQVAFNKLLREVQHQQSRLAAWREFEQKYQQRVGTELIPRARALQAAKRNMILSCAEVLEGTHGGAIPRKAERRQLIALLLEICQSFFIEVGADDEEVIRIHDEFASRSHAEIQQDAVDILRDDLKTMYGIDVPDDVGLDDLDYFVRAAQSSERAFAEGSEREARSNAGSGAGSSHRQGSRNSRKSRNSRNEKPEDPSDLGVDTDSFDPRQSLREVYRKLASALHPDRGIDHEDRQWRTEIMQRVNQAYADADLLALLELQLEIAQIDGDHVATIPETRLQQYNQMLKDRVSQLKRDVAAITDPFRQAMGHVPRSLTPAAVEADFNRHLLKLEADAAQLGEWAVAFRDPSYRKTWLKDWEREKSEAERYGAAFYDDEDLMDLSEIAETVLFQASRSPRRRKR